MKYNITKAVVIGSGTMGAAIAAHLANIGLRLGREKLRWDPAKEQVVGDDEAQKMLSRPMRGEWRLG